MNNQNQKTTPFNLKAIQIAFIAFAIYFSAPQSMAKGLSHGDQRNNSPGYMSSQADYIIPKVDIINKEGKKLSFIKEMDDGRPVIMSFVFTSCSAICPMLSHLFAQVQKKLADSNEKIHLVSVSIDPENDTPTKLSDYAKKFVAGTQWDFYTGTINTSVDIQKAFNVYRGDKMNHESVILMRSAHGKRWLRLEGFMTPADVISEYKKQLLTEQIMINKN